MPTPTQNRGSLMLQVDGRPLRCLMVGMHRRIIIPDWARAAASFAEVYGLSIGSHSPGGWQRATSSVALGRLQGIKTMYVKSRTLRPSRVMWRLNANQRSRAIIRALEDVDDIPTPDIIHGHWYPSTVYLATVTNELSCRYVHTEHSSTLTGKGEPSGVGENMLQILRDQAAGVIAVGSEVANALRSRGFDDVVVQPNPVDESAFNRSKSPSSGDEIRLVAVASLVPVKRHRLMLNAVRKLIDSGSRPVNLTIIGDGPLRRDIDQLVKDLGLIDNVAVTGWLDRPSVAQALARSHLYIHTSEVETFSISLVEAQMSGLPVVAIRAGGLTESIEAWQGESITFHLDTWLEMNRGQLGCEQHESIGRRSEHLGVLRANRDE